MSFTYKLVQENVLFDNGISRHLIIIIKNSLKPRKILLFIMAWFMGENVNFMSLCQLVHKLWGDRCISIMAMGAILNLCKLWTFAREFLWQILMCCLVESNQAVRAKNKLRRAICSGYFVIFVNLRKNWKIRN